VVKSRKMMNDSRQPWISLTIHYGDYGEQHKTAQVGISETLRRELMEPVELSDSPFSLYMASPGVFGGNGDAITIRRRAFKMRRAVAKGIADAMVPALLEVFGVNDVRDGYRVSDLEG
jgi:hypothetical protein